jgi:hypothetical protein
MQKQQEIGHRFSPLSAARQNRRRLSRRRTGSRQIDILRQKKHIGDNACPALGDC